MRVGGRLGKNYEKLQREIWVEMGQDKKEIMGIGQSKEIPKASPLVYVIAHWKDIAGHEGTENKRDLIRFCKGWWPLYKLGDGAQWPPSGILDYNTLLQLLLFLRREVDSGSICR